VAGSDEKAILARELAEFRSYLAENEEPFDACCVPGSWANLPDLEWRYYRAKDRIAKPALLPPKPKRVEPSITRKQLRSEIDRALHTVGKWAAEILKPLEERISKLEALPLPRFVGLWVEGYVYAPGNLVQWGGSLWHCNEHTKDKPGTSTAWTLAVKHGRDGKNGRDATEIEKGRK
jgi:hypothetical protein